MASAEQSNSEGEEFISFDEEDQLAVAVSRQEKLEGIEERDSESDECITTKPDPGWKDTSLEEIKVYLGLYVLFGITQLPSYKLYWSKDPLIGVPSVQKVMSRNHFKKLSQYFHVNNNANQVPREDPAYDKVLKCGLLLIAWFSVVKWN